MKTVSSKLIILDRDGTLIKLEHYLKDATKVELAPFVGESLKILSKSGYDFAIASNQSAIARKFASRGEVEIVNKKVLDLLSKYDVHIKKVMYCSHAPIDNCFCRKPKIEMGTQIMNSLGYLSNQTLVIGDSKTDIEFANNLGVRSILYSETNQTISKASVICNSWRVIPNTVLELMR
jgi:HAD superfamily hydrolase (TIGR01662 family)